MKGIRAAALAVFFFSVQSGAQTQQQDFSKIEVETTDLGHRMYMLEGGGGNITLAASNAGVIMVDSQFAPLTAKIKAAIGKITNQPVRYLINTHVHPDHTGGNANFANDGVIVLAQ